MNPLLYVDSYKVHHQKMYPDNMIQLYSNFTPRKSRIKEIDKVVVFGIQHFIKEYLIKKFNEEFFKTSSRDRLKNITHIRSKHGVEIEQFQKNYLLKLKIPIIAEYQRHCPVDTKHIEDLWDLGFLPIEIKALDEGTLCPIGVPPLTVKISDPIKYGQHAWLVNYIETLLSTCLWQPITSATIAYEYKKLLTHYALETTGSKDFVQWQGHDFSMRGMSSVESSILSGMGHLLSFTGTDTIPAIYQLETSYNAIGLIGASVPATEHSVMCMGTKENEIETFKRLLQLYPTGILSVVSDTWDLWKVCTEYLSQLKDEILARDGKLVIRPDSGDPVDIICGFAEDCYQNESGEWLTLEGDQYIKEAGVKGVIELLWDVFGGTINEQGYKVLDSHIGAIYGDSITLERAKQICERLKAKGFASTNVVFGIGSYTYQYNTRDTFGFAMKATYGEIICINCDKSGQPFGATDLSSCDKCGGSKIESREIWKDPITDDGTKKSKKGLLCVDEMTTADKDGIRTELICYDQRTWEQEKISLLTTVFKDSKLVKETTLEEIRNRLKI